MTRSSSTWQALLQKFKCLYGNHEWTEYLCDYHGFYRLLFTRKCKFCGKIEASQKPFSKHIMGAIEND